jgi:uncharacterized protein YrrD
MIKGREIISLPVLDSANGQQLCEVKGIIIDTDIISRVVAIVIEDKTIFHSAKIIPYQKIQQINHEFLTIGTEKDIIRTAEDPVINDCFIKQESHCVLGKEIYAPNGEKIGSIGDVLIIPETGIITGYEVTNGFVQDLIEGRNCIAFPSNCSQLENRIILNEEPQFINP